ncbi:ATP-binding protein, partial [Acinetobacter tandoii]
MNYAHSVQLTIQNDLISKLGKTSLVDALIELIWNALDADALNVRVVFEDNGLDSLNSIKIIDDGVGIHFSEAKNIFKNLGGSKKKNKLKSDVYGRFLHGKEGKGRLKAFSLGATVNWSITYKDESLDKLFTYKVAMHLNNPSDVKISDPVESDENLKSGVILEAYDVPKKIRKLNDSAKTKILETFAFYLYDYKNINLEIDGEKIDPKKIILAVTPFNLDFINYEGKDYSSTLRLTEWVSSKQTTSTYLSCN